MSKPFEITYSPANWDAPPGGIASTWSTPYGGLNVGFPENQIGPNYTPAVNNFMFRNGELRSRFATQFYLPGPDGSNPVLGLGSFLSKNLVWHTFAFTTNGMFQLKQLAQSAVQNNQNPWAFLGGPRLSSNNPVAWRTFQNVLYYTNGSGHLSAWDGAANTPITDVAFTGTTAPPPSNATVFSSLFLGELDSHIIMAYVYENGVAWPQRIRWSNIGFYPSTAGGVFGSNLGTAGATFDPTVNINAGLDDMMDVPDVITGIMFLGVVGFVFRQNGITQMTPTGQGTAPFAFDHMWASEQGIGNVYPGSIAQYGSYGMFGAENNIYQITPNSVNPVGGGARDAILLDLSQSVSSPYSTIISGYSPYRVFLTYKLFIPLPNGNTRIYVYSFDDNNWTSWTISGVYAGPIFNCWIGDPVVANQGSPTL